MNKLYQLILLLFFSFFAFSASAQDEGGLPAPNWKDLDEYDLDPFALVTLVNNSGLSMIEDAGVDQD